MKFKVLVPTILGYELIDEGKDNTMKQSTLGNTLRDIAIEAKGLTKNERYSLKLIAEEVDRLSQFDNVVENLQKIVEGLERVIKKVAERITP